MPVKPPAAESGAAMPLWVLGSPSPRVSFSQVAFRSFLCRGDGGRLQGARRATLPVRGSVSIKCEPPPCTLTAPRSSPNARREAASHSDDPLDPLHRRRAAYAPPGMFSGASFMNSPPPDFLAQSSVSEPVARAAASLEDLLPALVRRFAWSSDGRRGTARLEIGAGELAGSTLIVHVEAGRVRVHLDVPPGVDASAWQTRIHARLASRKIRADLVEVT